MKLKNVAKVQIGISAPKKFDEKSESTVPFIRAGIVEDLCNNNANFKEYLDKTKYKIVPKGTVIFAKSGMSSLKNRIYTLKEEAVIVGHLAGIICDEDIILPDYLEYYFRFNKPSKLIKNDSYPSIRTEDIENIDIEVPSIDTQKKIVFKLRKMQELIRIKSSELAKCDQLVKSQFVEMFRDIKEYKRLEEYSILITKGASPKWQGIEYKDEGTLFVTSENVRDGYIDINKPKYLDNKINEILPRSILKKGDILINIVGASIGRAAKYDYDYLANINQAVALVRTQNINNIFLLKYLNSEQAIKMYDDMKKGGARENLSLKNISDLKIPDAPIELQNKFAEFVKQVDKQKFEFEKQLKKLEELQASLMQEYFS